jgi:hypothetical protein
MAGEPHRRKDGGMSVASVLLLTEATMTEKPEQHQDRLPAEAAM